MTPFATAICNQIRAISRAVSDRDADDVAAVVQQLEFAAEVLKNDLIYRELKAGRFVPSDRVGLKLVRQIPPEDGP